jgi:DNA invertase Pin-like site-specific DNA recombinase
LTQSQRWVFLWGVRCPVCNSIFAVSLTEFGREMGKATSKKKAAAARRNGKKGGRPRKKQ